MAGLMHRPPVARHLSACLAGAFLLLAAATEASAQSDTTAVGPLFTYRDALLAGGVVVTARLVHPLDDYFAQRLQDSSTQDSHKLQALAKFVRTTATPGSGIIGGTMYLVGRLSKNKKLASLGLHGT